MGDKSINQNPSTPPSVPNQTIKPPDKNTSNDSIDSFLLNPSNQLLDVLRFPSITSLYNRKNSALVTYLSSPDMLYHFIDLFTHCEERHIIEIMRDLCLGTNPSLLQSLTNNLECFEKFSAILLLNDPNNSFRLGLTSKILSTACTKWPDTFLNLFHSSYHIIPTLLNSLNNAIIHQFICNITQTPPAEAHNYLWAYLASMIPNLSPPPQLWLSDAPIKQLKEESSKVFQSRYFSQCRLVRIDSILRCNIYHIFRMFVQCFPEQKPFKNALSFYLEYFISLEPKGQELVELFDLALNLDPNLIFLQFSSSTICNLISMESSQKAIQYLSRFSESSIQNFPQIEAHFIFKFLTAADKMSTFILHQILTTIEDSVGNFPVLVSKTRNQNSSSKEAQNNELKEMKQLENQRYFMRLLQHIIAFIWNRPEFNRSLSYRALLLQMSILSDYEPAWDGFSNFKCNVVDKFAKGEEFPRNYHIDENGWDEELIQYFLGALKPLEIEKDLQKNSDVDPKHRKSFPSDGDDFGKKKECLML